MSMTVAGYPVGFKAVKPREGAPGDAGSASSGANFDSFVTRLGCLPRALCVACTSRFGALDVPVRPVSRIASKLFKSMVVAIALFYFVCRRCPALEVVKQLYSDVYQKNILRLPCVRGRTSTGERKAGMIVTMSDMTTPNHSTPSWRSSGRADDWSRRASCVFIAALPFLGRPSKPRPRPLP